MKIYNKLVRDKIPEIIAAAGKKCTVSMIDDGGKIIELLESKVLEEWAEYQESKSVEEIADVLEVLFALSERLGVNQEELLKLREEKILKRGRFDKGLLLVSVEE